MGLDWLRRSFHGENGEWVVNPLQTWIRDGLRIGVAKAIATNRLFLPVSLPFIFFKFWSNTLFLARGPISCASHYEWRYFNNFELWSRWINKWSCKSTLCHEICVSHFECTCFLERLTENGAMNLLRYISNHKWLDKITSLSVSEFAQKNRSKESLLEIKG